MMNVLEVVFDIITRKLINKKKATETIRSWLIDENTNKNFHHDL
jgi:hypothetical protein